MRLTLITFALTCLAHAALAACPPLPDRAEEKARLMEAIRTAPDEMSARPRVNAL